MNVAWDQVAVGVAAVIGLIYVARTLRSSNKDVLSFLGNHMNRATEAQQDSARAMQAVADRLERVEGAVDEHTRRSQ